MVPWYCGGGEFGGLGKRFGVVQRLAYVRVIVKWALGNWGGIWKGGLLRTGRGLRRRLCGAQGFEEEIYESVGIPFVKWLCLLYRISVPQL